MKENKSSLTVKLLIIALIPLGFMATLSLSQTVKAFISYNKNVATKVDNIAEELLNQKCPLGLLPTRYAVDQSSLLPPSNQARRGVCWIFSTIFAMEAQYRANGIKKGFLKPNEYVTFSKQAYGAFLGDQCKSHPEIPVCKHGGLGMKENNTDDNLGDAIYYFQKAFPDLNKSILPEEVCPYIETPSPETDFLCPGMYDAIKKNPLTWNIKSYHYATNVNNTKRILYNHKRPLTIGVPIGETYFYAPCDSSSYSTDADCVSKTTKCPEGYQSEYCKKVTVEGRIYDGTFTYVNDPKRSSFLGAHEMNVVGYNDEWVYTSKWDTDKSLSLLKGGFILHNSWRENGHSVDFLMGRRSPENEAVICPNHIIPQYWIPVSLDCLKENNGDETKCPFESKYVRGKGVTNIPDKLKCTNAAYCDQKKKYFLTWTKDEGSFQVQHLFNGLDLTRFASIDEDGNIETFQFDKLPFFYLGRVFAPENIVQNNKDDCGYYMFPYDAIDMLQRKDWDKLDYFHTADLEFEFPDSAYAANKAKYPDLDYSLIEKSTHVWDPTPFDGPLPYKYVF